MLNLAGSSFILLSIVGRRNKRSGSENEEESGAELIDDAYYLPLAACCLRLQIRLKLRLIRLAARPDQVRWGRGPGGCSYFKPQHPLYPHAAAAPAEELFFRMCRVSPAAKDRKVFKWGWSCIKQIRGGVYVCGGIESMLL